MTVPPHIRAEIKHHLDVYVADDPDALLLTGRTACGHLAPATFRKAWHAALKAIGCQWVQLHDLRHYAGVMTARTGATLTENMGRLGDASASASLLYQDVVAGRDEEVAAALSALAAG